jgi:hypothetical protein
MTNFSFKAITTYLIQGYIQNKNAQTIIVIQKKVK